MDFQVDSTFPDLPDVPRFDPNDLNKEPVYRQADKRDFADAMEVKEREQTTGSDTDTDTATSMVLGGKGVRFSPKADHVFEFPEISEDFQGDLPGYILYMRDKDSSLKTFRTYAEISEYLVKTTSDGTRRNPETDILVSEILSIPLKRIAHQTTMGEYLRYLYANDLLMDVNIEVGGEEFMSHRIALCCYSNFLAELFYKSKRTKIPFEIKINGISAEAFATFLEFIYTGELIITPAIAADLLLLADYLRVKALQKRRGLIIGNLSLEQIVKIVARSRDDVPKYVIENFIQQIKVHFLEAAQTKYFCEIDIETICTFLASDDLVVSKEAEVYQISMNWIFYDLKLRATYTERVLGLIRYCYMSQGDLFKCVESNSIVRDRKEYHTIFKTANWVVTAGKLGRPEPFGYTVPPPRKCYKYAPTQIHQRPTTITPPPQYNIPVHDFPPRPPTPTAPRIPSPLMTSTPVTSQPKPKDDVLLITPYTPSIPSPLMTSTQMTSLPKPKHDVPLLTPYTPSIPSPLMTSTPMTSLPNPKHNLPQLKPTAPIPSLLMTSTPVTSPPKPLPKPVAKPVLTQSHIQRMMSPIPKSVDILVIGGFETDRENPPEAKLDTKDRWVHFCQLPEPKENHAVALLDGKLYLIGGCNPTQDGETPVPTKQVFRMAIDDKRWIPVPDMIEARTHHCACTLGGKVYAIGGLGYNNRVLASVECYSPQANMWTYVNFMNVPRFAATAASLYGKIYLAGGIGEAGSDQVPVLSEVELFDPTLNRWYTKKDLRFPRSNASLVRVADRLFLCGGTTSTINVKSSQLISVADIDEYIEKHDVWSHRSDMSIARHDAGVAVAGSRIYIIGGVSTTNDSVLQSIECYDTCACAWLSGLKDLPIPSRHIRCASMVSEWSQVNPN